MAKVLILGSSGLLGSRLSRILESKFEVIGTHFKNAHCSVQGSNYLDISSLDMFETLIERFTPQYVINCIGATSVEDCERFPERAMLLNAIFPYRVAKASNYFKFKFLQISTDHYANLIRETRDELMHPIPVNSYGYSKFTGELLILNESPTSLILRTNFFGVSTRGNHSILDFAINSFKKPSPIFGYQDVWFTPLGVSQIGRLIESTLEWNIAGILNLSGTESTTKLAFLREVAVALDLDPNLVLAAKSSDLSSSVPRPTNLSLDNSKLLSLGVKLPGLKDMIREELSYKVVS